jgi:formylglycine-generating enzyme required for sulfatase activity
LIINLQQVYYKNSPLKDPVNTTKSEKTVLRGGSWYYGYSNCRVALRYRYNPILWDYVSGFRLVAL